jgi:hypothetical protein
MCEVKQPRPSPRAFLNNLQGPEALDQKTKLLHNNWLKLKNFQDCCGHPGEPGC